MKNEVGFHDQARLFQVHNLIQLEEMLLNNPELVRKLDISFAPTTYNEVEILDEDEKKLYNYLKDKNLEEVYPKLIQFPNCFIESVDDLENLIILDEDSSIRP